MSRQPSKPLQNQFFFKQPVNLDLVNDTNRLFQQGLILLNQGRREQAKELFEKIIKLNAKHFDAINLLAIISAQLKDFEKADELLDKAIKINSNNASSHCNRGNVLLELKKFESAISHYNIAIRLKKDYALAYQNKSIALGQLKLFEDALISVEKAIKVKPNYAEAYYQRGFNLTQLNQFDEALASYEKALNLKSDYPEAYFDQGNVYKELKRFNEALASYEKAIELKIDHSEAYSNRGNVLFELKLFEEALASHEKAIELKIDYAEAYSNRGLALVELKRFDEALASYEQAIELKSDFAEAYSNRGNSLIKLKRVEEALSSYETAIEIKSDYAEAYLNRGLALIELKRFVETLASYDKAIEIKGDYADAYWNKSNALLLMGDFLNGWDLYEWRWRNSNPVGVLSFREPLWLGNEPIQGKTILIHAEQGLGDTLQFIRYVPMVASLGAKVMVEVQAPLFSLFENMQGISVLLKKGDPLPPFDFHCPMMSLPLAFKTTLDSIPACPQFVIPEVKTQFWSDKLGLKAKPRVGLVWNGGFRPDQPEIWDVNERRNLPLQHLKALVGIDVEFISLQKGEPAESEFRQTVASGWDGPVIHDHVIELKDFSDTAALVMNLDLVIAVDTSTAHLAASIGKPVWLLNRYDTCWRWLLDREDSPWYPSVKIYRQTSSGDWDGVMQKVLADLLALSASATRL